MAREVALMMMGRASSSAASSSSSSRRVSCRLTAMASAAKEVSSLALLFLRGERGLAWGGGPEGGWGWILGCPPLRAHHAGPARHQNHSLNLNFVLQLLQQQSPWKAARGDRSGIMGGWDVPPHPEPPCSPLQDDGGRQRVIRGALQGNAAVRAGTLRG